MSDKQLNEKELNDVAGGYGCIRMMTCPECEAKYTKPRFMPERDIIDGVECAFCRKCEKWIPVSEWKVHST